MLFTEGIEAAQGPNWCLRLACFFRTSRESERSQCGTHACTIPQSLSAGHFRAIAGKSQQWTFSGQVTGCPTQDDW